MLHLTMAYPSHLLVAHVLLILVACYISERLLGSENFSVWCYVRLCVIAAI